MIEISRFLRVVCYFLIIVMPLTSWALSFTVTNTNDSGEGSLRQAVADAVLSPDDDTIEFDPSLTGQTISLTSGEIPIGDDFTTANIAIKGLGADNLTISGGDSSRVFIVGDNSQLALDGVKITDTIPSAIKVDGHFSATKLTLTNCIVTNNQESDSDPAFAAINSTGEVEVDNCTISSNAGNGIEVSLDRLKVTNSTITDNDGHGILGGFPVFSDDNGGISMIVSDSTISSNRVGGISAIEGSLKLFNSTITNNSGAAVRVSKSGNAEINESTLSNNNRGIDFSGVHEDPDTGGATASLTVTNTTISGNAGEDNGGGILVENILSFEGPVEMSVTLTNTTITNNSATEGGGILAMPDPDGATTTVTVNNSIIVGNGADASTDVAGNFISNGFNIIGDIGTSSGFESDIIEADVNTILDTTLSDNSGPTKTHLLVTDSPAIDAADAECPDADQRGVPRPQGAGCDVGAVELERVGEPPIEVSQCDIRADYESGSCSGKFNAYSLADLEAYKASNFGKDDTGNFQNLGIKASLGSAGDILDIESPCRIILSSGLTLTGDFVSLDALKGVWTNNLDIQAEGAACLLSETGDVKLKKNSSITAKQLVIQANKIAKIGKNTQVNVSDSLIVKATGSPSKSRAIIDKGANLLVGSDMVLDSAFRAVIQSNAVVDVTGNLQMNAKTLNNCVVKNSATISFGSKTGNCAARLP